MVSFVLYIILGPGKGGLVGGIMFVLRTELGFKSACYRRYLSFVARFSLINQLLLQMYTCLVSCEKSAESLGYKFPSTLSQLG